MEKRLQEDMEKRLQEDAFVKFAYAPHSVNPQSIGNRSVTWIYELK